MTDYTTQASFNRAALLLGLTTGADVVAWADAIIATESEAPAELFDVALLRPDDLSELRHALQPLATQEESLLVLRALLDVARGELDCRQRSTKDTVTVLAQSRHFLNLPPKYVDEIDTLQDDFMLASASVAGNTAEVEMRLHAWLAQFEGGRAALEGST